MSDLQIKDNFFVEVRINMFYISMKGGGGVLYHKVTTNRIFGVPKVRFNKYKMANKNHVS